MQLHSNKQQGVWVSFITSVDPHLYLIIADLLNPDCPALVTLLQVNQPHSIMKLLNLILTKLLLVYNITGHYSIIGQLVFVFLKKYVLSKIIKQRHDVANGPNVTENFVVTVQHTQTDLDNRNKILLN